MKRIIIFIFVVFLSGCIGTKAGAYKTFSEDIKRLIGSSFDDAYVYNIGYLRDLTPDKEKELVNGGLIREYKVKPPRKQKCSVIIEVDKNFKIISASSSGPDCYRAY